MNKTSLVIVAFAAVGVAGNAVALDTSVVRRLEVDAGGGAQGRLPLAALQFTALGQDGRFCDYLVDVTSATNGNDVVLCTFRELTTPFSPSCIANELVDFVTLVEAGTGAPSGATPCAGYNLKGESFGDVTLVLGESSEGLRGIQTIATGGLPTVYPIRIS